MRLLIAVFDRKAEVYGEVYNAVSRAVAIRDFEAACNMPDSKFAKWPEDFQLVSVGEFDPVTGHIESWEPKVISEALDHITVTIPTTPQLEA